MKKIIASKSFLLFSVFNLLIAINAFSQQNKGINYQGIARRIDGTPLVEQTISLKLSIKEGSINGINSFSEIRQVKTNQFGLFNVVIGSNGATSQIGTLANVDWKTGNKFLQVEIDPSGGNNFISMGISQLQSVPFAIHAEQAAPIGLAAGDLSGNYPNPTVNKIQGKNISTLIPSIGQILKWNGTAWTPSEDVSGTGTEGPKGDKGDPGTNGTNGTDGAPGLKGDKGDPGTNGTNGTDGAPGLKGDKGDPGTNGTNGTDGAPGLKGDKGDPGTNGTNGTDGAPGLKGDKGDPGTNGTNGTDGAPGLKGDKGDPGTNGTNGTDGAPGLKGDPGLDGLNGANGLDGGPGINGVDGTPGIDGLNGIDGLDGSPGINGVDGKTILNGTIDPTTSDGTDGDFYLNTITYDLFGPKSDGNWASGINLRNGAADFVDLSTNQTINGLKIFNSNQGLLATGNVSQGDTLSLGAGSRMMWYPQKAAFRVGLVDGTQWNHYRTGYYSFATGENTIASANSASAMGMNTIASGNYSAAFGNSTNASGISAFAMGGGTESSGDYSVAFGGGTKAIGNGSFAAGSGTQAGNTGAVAFGGGARAMGDYSFAAGAGAQANGNFSAAFGNGTTASGISAFAMGSGTIASGLGSFAMGNVTNAPSYGEIAMGTFNTIYTPSSIVSNVASDRLFSLGNGNDANNTSDALTILKNGNTTINGTLTAAGITYPNAIGNNGQVLTSDGTGSATWTNAASGGISNFAESNYLNNSKTGVKLLALNPANDIDLVISPKGTGAILAQQPDESTTGGNNRGSKAVDFQMIRGSNSQVASGNYAVISGGENNTASGSVAFVGGGTSNIASGNISFAAGRGNTAQSYGESVLGVYSTIGTGSGTTYVAGDRLFVIGNGTFSNSRSNAITVLKNANTTIGGSLTINQNGTNSSFSLPLNRGTSGQILTTNGSGLTTWTNPSSQVFNFASGTIPFSNGNSDLESNSNFSWDNQNGALNIISKNNPNLVNPSLRVYPNPNEPSMPTWMRMGDDGIGAEFGISGGNDQFFVGTVQGDAVIKGFSGTDDKKLFIGAGLNSPANIILSPNGETSIGGIIFPTDPGDENQVLTTDGYGYAYWEDPVEYGSNDFVDLSTNQSIYGVKDFSSDIKVNNITIGRGKGGKSSNTALGFNAIQDNTDGYSLVAIGRNTLNKNTTGIYNSALGESALFSNTDGTGNTAFGTGSLIYNTTGSNNTSMGLFTSNTNISGLGITTIGAYADVSQDGLSNSTAIGVGAVVNESNTIQLGNPYVNKVKTNGKITTGAITFPNTDGTAGQVLTTDGQGNASWTSASGGSTNLSSGATGILPISNGGTGSSTKNFVDLSTTQSISGQKTFSADMNINGITLGRGSGNKATNTSLGYESIKSNTIVDGSGIALSAFGYQSLTNNLYGNYNTAFGAEALKTNTNGEYNTAVGASALTLNQTGYENVAVGFMSLDKNNNSYNTGVGTFSLENNTSGTGNTAIGNASLNINTTGSNNTAIGYKANVSGINLSNATAIGAAAIADESNSIRLGNTNILKVKTSGKLSTGAITFPNTDGTVGQVLTTDGSGNVSWANQSSSGGSFVDLSTDQTINGNKIFFNDLTVNGLKLGHGAGNLIDNFTLGSNSMTKITEGGTYNSALGINALSENTNGFANTAVGYNSLKMNSIGDYNTAIGESALMNSSGSNYNVALGSAAMLGNTSGDSNIGIGYKANATNTTGTQNIAIGFEAGVISNNLTNTIAIGHQAKARANNQAVIGTGSISEVLMGEGLAVVKGGNYISSSDARLKDNIRTINYGLKDILLLKPVNFSWKKNSKEDIGFIAQEVKKVIPELVYGVEGDLTKNESLGVNYSQMVAVLTKAIQEQQSQIEDLKQSKTEQKQQIEELKILINQLLEKIN